jgi:beta-N-acetylhexosaminidase
MDDLLQDITPFKNLMNHGLDALMPAHVVYPQVDDKPAGFSARWIKDILQGQLKFKGVIFSDDLSMQGAHFIEDIADRVSASLDSGCDMALICNHPELVAQIIDKDWGVNEKLQLMQGFCRFKSDKISHQHHLVTIRDLL